MLKLIDIIIPHSNRFKNLRHCLYRLSLQTIIPNKIIISDHSQNPKRMKTIREMICDKLPLHIIESNIPFVRGPSINLGRIVSDSELIFVLDADLYFDQKGIYNILKYFGQPPKHEFVGFCGFRFLKNGERKPNRNTHKRVYGGFQVFRTDDFDAVGGYNPFMKGWGYEDVDLRDRMISHGVKMTVLPYEYDHLYHPPTKDHKALEYNKWVSANSVWNGKTWCFNG